MKPESSYALHQDWQCRAYDASQSHVDNLSAPDWLPATVPGTIYEDLLRAGRIPDPNIGMNEQAVQWVALQDWCYQLVFQVDMHRPAQHVDLVFEGLDTFATVWLNGTQILQSDNMFVPARVPVHNTLVHGKNHLAIVFDSALRRGRELEAQYGQRPLWNGDSSRLYVRKAQYHYGWDWGPVLLTAGPWKTIALHCYDVRIAGVECTTHLAADHTHATLALRTELAGHTQGTHLTHHVFDPQNRLIAEITQESGGVVTTQLTLDAPQLWWPAGHGEQARYQITTTVTQNQTPLATLTQRIGVRQATLIQAPVTQEAGQSFYFEINGKALFTGGANWIPDDNLLNRITPARYHERVCQARDANMLMLRVWGGGIYEDDAFYEACDALGVLVWQDFLFACGLYPAHDTFLSSIVREAEAAVRRLRHHPSLILWCGNNEDYALAESHGQYGTGIEDPHFSARTIYEHLLPTLCTQFDPQRAYWPGSPFSPDANGPHLSSDATVGDRHSWEIWHGPMLPYQDYHTVQARFVSEFGLQSHPSLPLLERVIPEPQRYPGSQHMAWHNKSGNAKLQDGHRRLATYLADNLRVADTLAAHVYASQFVQAEAMRYAYQDFRRRWQHPGARACGGALVWQLNDCWPVTSWAIIDAAAVVKPAWHTIRRALAPLAAGVRHTGAHIEAWLVNESGQDRIATLRLRRFDLNGACLQQAQIQLTARDGEVSNHSFPAEALTVPTVCELTVLEGDHCVARATAWPEPHRFYPLADAALHLTRHETHLELHAQKPCKGIWFSGEGLHFSDNFIDLMPGETLTLAFHGHPHTPIQVQALDQPTQILAPLKG